MGNVDELSKLKALLDAGTITQQEFEIEKNKIIHANTPPLTPSQPQYPNYRQPYAVPRTAVPVKKTNGCLLALIIVSIVVAVSGAIIVSFSLYVAQRASSTEQVSAEQAIDSNPSPSVSPTVEPSASAPQQTFRKVGDTITLGDWEVTLVSAEVKNEIEISQYYSYEADDGDKYVVASLRVKNISDDATTFLPSYYMGSGTHVKVTDLDGNEFSASNLLGEDLHDETLNPLSSAEGIVAFSIVEESAVLKDLTLVLSSGFETEKFSLGE